MLPESSLGKDLGTPLPRALRAKLEGRRSRLFSEDVARLVEEALFLLAQRAEALRVDFVEDAVHLAPQGGAACEVHREARLQGRRGAAVADVAQ